jgi:hypothetical protein
MHSQDSSTIQHLHERKATTRVQISRGCAPRTTKPDQMYLNCVGRDVKVVRPIPDPGQMLVSSCFSSLYSWNPRAAVGGLYVTGATS